MEEIVCKGCGHIIGANSMKNGRCVLCGNEDFPHRNDKEPVATVLCSDRVMPACSLCENVATKILKTVSGKDATETKYCDEHLTWVIKTFKPHLYSVREIGEQA